MTVELLLVSGDDGLGVSRAVDEFAARIGVPDRTELVPERSPDEATLDRAVVESASVGLFGPHLVVLRQPLKAVGRAAGPAEKLLDLVRRLPPGAALALAEERSSRDIGKPPVLLSQLGEVVRERGGMVLERLAPRRNELAGWTVRHAAMIGVDIEQRAATLLAQRVGGAVWESDVERGEQTRVVDSELRKLRIYAGERPISVSDVEALTTDARPASVFAITNAVDRREPAAAAAALERALAEDQPVLRIMASLAGRISDLIVARELSERGAPPAELTRRVGRGNARAAERVVEAARRYGRDELEAMLRGLFEADMAVKANEIEPAPAITAWLGEYLLGGRRSTGR
jgi:DNA polymerase-3 subunit delta